ncbi:hypothetical protein ES704_01227 [subsurface metagenome]|jgi:hypothetical protein
MKKMKRIIAVLMLTSVMLLVGILAIGAEKQVPYEIPRSPRVTEVIFVSGTNYEMGYDYGYQVAEQIRACVDGCWMKAITKAGNYDEAIGRLQGFQYYIKKYTPELIDEMIGIANGATAAGFKTSYADILVVNCDPYFGGVSNDDPKPSPLDEVPPKEYQIKYEIKIEESTSLNLPDYSNAVASVGDELNDESCSRWAVWGDATKDGKLLCGDSLDGAGQRLFTYIGFPDEGNAFIAVADYYGDISINPHMNNKGLWLSAGALQGPRDIDTGYGIPLNMARRHLSQFCENAEDAKDELLSWVTPGKRGHNCILADTKGNAYIFELSHVLKTYRKAGDFGEIDWVAAANTFVIPENCALCDPPIEPFVNDWRIRQLWGFFSQYVGDVDLEFGKMIYRYQDPDGHKTIGHRRNDHVTIAQPDDGDKGKWYMWTGTVGPNVKYGGGLACMDWPNGHFTLELRSSPAEVTSRANRSAKTALGKVDLALRGLSLPEHAADYLLLRELLSKANNEWYVGSNNEVNAFHASKDEAIYLYSKALTAYTKCEAMCNGMYEVIVPQPTTPKDLGLKSLKPY